MIEHILSIILFLIIFISITIQNILIKRTNNRINSIVCNISNHIKRIEKDIENINTVKEEILSDVDKVLKEMLRECDVNISKLSERIDTLENKFNNVVKSADKLIRLNLDKKYADLVELYCKIFDDLRDLDNRVSLLYNTVDYLKQELVELERNTKT